MRDDADMRHRMARRVEAFQFDGLADLDDVTGLEAAVNALDLVLGAGMRQQFGVRRADDLIVAAGMVAVMVRVQHLRDVPVLCLRSGEAFLVVERIDRERLAGFGAGDQVIEIAAGIGGPDLFDDHRLLPACSNPSEYRAREGAPPSRRRRWSWIARDAVARSA